MVATAKESWAELVMACRDNAENFPRLQERLRRIIRAIAARKFSWMGDDAAQVAFIKIWEKLPTVDVDRPDKVKSYLLNIAINAMTDEARRLGRHDKHESTVAGDDGDDLLEIMAEFHDRNNDYHFDGILADYLAFVDKTGNFRNAHRAVARKRRVSVAKASGEFHKAVREFIQRHDIECKPQYQDVVNRVLEVGPIPPDGIVAQLKRAIIASGLTYREIARRAGIGHNQINYLMKNCRVVSLETSEKIFFALGKRVKVL